MMMSIRSSKQAVGRLRTSAYALFRSGVICRKKVQVSRLSGVPHHGILPTARCPFAGHLDIADGHLSRHGAGMAGQRHLSAEGCLLMRGVLVS